MSRVITGHSLKRMIQTLSTRRAIALRVWEEKSKYFSDEPRPDLSSAEEEVHRLELQIVALQVLQERYNLHVRLSTGGTLAHGIRAVGALGRGEKRWRNLVAPDRDRWSRSDGEIRRDGEQVKVLSLDKDSCQARAEKMLTDLGVLREALANANATEVKVEDLDPNFDLGILF